MPSDEIIETMARAYDREQAAQMGEPDPWKYPNPGAEAESLACARAALSAAEAAGWVMVPKEPTPEMLTAAYNVPRSAYWPANRSRSAYRAMLAAAGEPE